MKTGGLRPPERRRSRLSLTLAEREEISRGLVAGLSIRSIAADLKRAAAASEGARFLLMAGKRLDEPVARGGPFVMNTRVEVQEAFADFRAGQFG